MKRNVDLSQEEKEYNKIYFKEIMMEYTICRLKRYRIMDEVFRNKLRKYKRISDIVSDLVNYRMRTSIGKKKRSIALVKRIKSF